VNKAGYKLIMDAARFSRFDALAQITRGPYHNIPANSMILSFGQPSGQLADLQCQAFTVYRYTGRKDLYDSWWVDILEPQRPWTYYVGKAHPEPYDGEFSLGSGTYKAYNLAHVWNSGSGFGSAGYDVTGVHYILVGEIRLSTGRVEKHIQMGTHWYLRYMEPALYKAIGEGASPGR